MSLPIAQAVVNRLNGTEDLSAYPRAQEAQQSLQVPQPTPFDFGYGTMTKQGAFPSIRFYEDVGPFRFGQAVDIGIIQDVIIRFEIWQRDWDNTVMGGAADSLELLFDFRRGAPNLPLSGQGKIYETALFTPLQAPLHDDDINAFYGLISFKMIESRP